MEPTITTERRGHVFVIGLDRPDKKNAFSLQMLRELSAAYTSFERDAELRCALLHSTSNHFTTGLDLAEVGPAVAQGDALFPVGDIDPMDLFEPRRRKPVVCAVQGWCITIGVELLLASDIRLAASDTRFAQMEVQRGIMPFGGATLRFPQVCGWGNAMRWLLTGEGFDATEALRIGLVQEVTAPEGLLERGLALAELVAEQAPLAVQATRASARIALEHGAEAALAGLISEARALMGTDDAREGVMSFLERRKARYNGR